MFVTDLHEHLSSGVKVWHPVAVFLATRPWDTDSAALYCSQVYAVQWYRECFGSHSNAKREVAG